MIMHKSFQVGNLADSNEIFNCEFSVVWQTFLFLFCFSAESIRWMISRKYSTAIEMNQNDYSNHRTIEAEGKHREDYKLNNRTVDQLTIVALSQASFLGYRA